MMNILVTGANGFIGKNLVAELKNRSYTNLFEFDIDSNESELKEFINKCDFVFHLAGVNRPKNEEEFMQGNWGSTSHLLNMLKDQKREIPVLITSSIQADNDNPYGKSKKASEEIVFEYGNSTKSKVYVYRLPNVFGKWSRPNYNTVVATFCNNIALGHEIKIDNADSELLLVYIDDVVEEFIKSLESKTSCDDGFYSIPIINKVKLGKLASIIMGFKNSRDNLSVIDTNNDLENKLYSTYLSFLPRNEFAYDLKMHTDGRGSFAEFLRTGNSGQVSVNISKPGITKGNHWHHSKNEKFLVVNGLGSINLRKLNCDKVIEYKVSGEKLQVVDIPPGYTHNIKNTGKSDMITVIWVNECFDPDNPDTFYLEV